VYRINHGADEKFDRFRILIVDDIPDNIQVLAGILGAGYEISFATNGPQALDMVCKNVPDLILLDVMMPDMDGFAVLKALQQNPTTCDIPVIFVTAHQGNEAETTALEAGAVDFIPKPINPSVARARVSIHARLVRRTHALQELSQRYKKMADNFRELSIHDGLTGLYNRHYLVSLLGKEIARAQREKQPLSLAMLDIDHFKKINDVYGHARGDAVLAAIGKLIQGRIRKSDTAFRYGGEEFMLVLPNTLLADAHFLCEGIREMIATQIVGGMDRQYVKVSIGIAQLGMEDDSGEETIHRADLALYQAKNKGRNRVEVSPSVPFYPALSTATGTRGANAHISS
jgi:diguanylate cyclase (GGDEF)-like protein